MGSTGTGRSRTRTLGPQGFLPRADRTSPPEAAAPCPRAVVLPIAEALATAMSSTTIIQGVRAWCNRTGLGCNMRRTCVVRLTRRSHAAHVSHLPDAFRTSRIRGMRAVEVRLLGPPKSRWPDAGSSYAVRRRCARVADAERGRAVGSLQNRVYGLPKPLPRCSTYATSGLHAGPRTRCSRSPPFRAAGPGRASIPRSVHPDRRLDALTAKR